MVQKGKKGKELQWYKKRGKGKKELQWFKKREKGEKITMKSKTFTITKKEIAICKPKQSDDRKHSIPEMMKYLCCLPEISDKTLGTEN